MKQTEILKMYAFIFQLMGPQFISSIKPHLEGIWTEEHEQAWENLFKLMCYYMKKGMCSI